MYNLIIVGAGILGAAHAYHAAQLGLRVLLLEKDNRPVGSTVRNFGQIVPSGLAGRWFDYGRRTLELYREWQTQADLSLRQNGSVYVASDDDEWQLVNELYDRRQAERYPCELLSAAQTLARFPALQPDYVRGGLWFPDEMSAEPDRFIHRFIAFLTARHAVDYRPNAAVVEVQPHAGGAILTLAGGERLTADRVLICGGYEFRLLFPALFRDSKLVVSKLQMLQSVPIPAVSLPGNILTGLTIRRYESFAGCPSFAQLDTPDHLAELQRWGIHILFKQALDGSFIIGDTHEYAPAAQIDALGYGTNDYLNRLMLNEARRIVRFPIEPIQRTWAGFYAQTPDEIFEHDIDQSIRVVTGIGGKGMSSGAGYAEASIRALWNQ